MAGGLIMNRQPSKSRQICSPIAISLLAIMMTCCIGLRSAFAAEPPAEKKPAATSSAKDSTPKPEEPLNLTAEQRKVSAKFKELERVILRMAEVTAQTDPRRAALLRRAFLRSKEKQLDSQFDKLVALIEQNQLYQAGKSQADVQKELHAILELLMTGDRDKQIENEKQRIKKYIAEVNRIIRQQQGLQGQTEGETPESQLRQQQAKLADRTDELLKEIKKHDGDKAEDKKLADADKSSDESKDDKKVDGEKKDGEQKSAGDKERGSKNDSGDKKSDEKNKSDDQKSGDKNKSKSDKADSKKSDNKKSDGEKTDGKKSDAKKSQEGSDSKSKSKSGEKSKGDSKSDDKNKSDKKNSQQSPGSQSPKGEQSDEESKSQSSEDKQSQEEQTPGRKRIQAAEERMRAAEKKLKEAKRKDAVKEQEAAVEELQQAKAELERILRQMREEEVERSLAQLETRFRKILTMQVEVYDNTVRLDKVAANEQTREHQIEAGRLARREQEIIAETDRAQNLLREEGSAVAFPEAVSQMREDMLQVEARLSATNLGSLTQGIEKDVIKALEEMVAALQKAQKELKEQKSKGGGGGGMPEDSPLVDKLAELKMIRALQVRVNQRTLRYSQLLRANNEQADQPDLILALQKLSERQQRIHQTTRDIVLGKNK